MSNLTASEQMIVTKYDLYFESRLSKLEANELSMRSDIHEIKSDLRLMFKCTIGGFLLTLTGFGSMFMLMAHGFKWL